jgi:threonine synthase
LRADVLGSAHSDDETRQAIRRVYERYGYVMDPHTAVGFAALEGVLAERPSAAGMLLATAHPAKFAEIVQPETGRTVPLPERLRACLDRPSASLPLEPDLATFRAALDG